MSVERRSKKNEGGNCCFYSLYHAGAPSNLPYIPVGQCLGRCPGGSETVPQKALEKRMRSEKGASQGFYRSWPMKTGEGERRGEEADNIQRKDVHGTETRGARCLHGLADRFPGA